ncbi:hypothetical protein, partial [Salmonella sp. s54925]|uniref:hypothetical protein n=1 Tax=Salmonella sp. s54925 TaxID=3159674 RepID=UPI00397EA0B1
MNEDADEHELPKNDMNEDEDELYETTNGKEQVSNDGRFAASEEKEEKVEEDYDPEVLDLLNAQ